MRLIDADELLKELEEWEADLYDTTPERQLGVTDAIVIASQMPTVDAVPVDFIRSEIERMKEDNNQYYSECEAYADDLDILLMEWEKRKNETD